MEVCFQQEPALAGQSPHTQKQLLWGESRLGQDPATAAALERLNPGAL